MGQLNILPKKSWHVYNVENQERVLKDQKKAELGLKEQEKKRKQLEAESRIEKLRKRAKGGGEKAAKEGIKANSERHKCESINFWKEHEEKGALVKDKEYEKERVEERNKARIIPYTKLGGTYNEDKNKPWWASVRGKTKEKVGESSKNFGYAEISKRDMSEARKPKINISEDPLEMIKANRKRVREKNAKIGSKDEFFGEQILNKSEIGYARLRENNGYSSYSTPGRRKGRYS